MGKRRQRLIETLRRVVCQSDDRVHVRLSESKEIPVTQSHKSWGQTAPESPQRRGQRVACKATTPYSLPIHVLFFQHRKFSPSQRLFFALLPHRMPPPDLRLWPPGYIAAERRGVLLAKERQRARDGRAGMRACGETANAAGRGERGECRDERRERGGRGVGGEREEERMGAELGGETR